MEKKKKEQNKFQHREYLLQSTSTLCRCIQNLKTWLSQELRNLWQNYYWIETKNGLHWGFSHSSLGRGPHFSYFSMKTWVLRSASVRHFLWVPTSFHWDVRKLTLLFGWKKKTNKNNIKPYLDLWKYFFCPIGPAELIINLILFHYVGGVCISLMATCKWFWLLMQFSVYRCPFA